MIGVFDSGVGGLTVLKALRAKLPEQDFVYLGDTARLPYGTKSPQTVISYARQAVKALLAHKPDLLVIACNTATAHALTSLQADYPDIPVIGVIAPGTQAAARYRRILVLATEGTVRSGAYSRAILEINPQAEVSALAATLLVGLAEEGWTHGPEPQAIIRRYLATCPIIPEAVVLGCTHFPLLRESIAAVLGPDVALVDSAETTAAVVARQIETLAPHSKNATLTLLATDGRERFAALATRFLDHLVDPAAVDLINL